jgi:cell division protein ZapD
LKTLVPNVIYEQPLNERVRTFLRLDFLFNEFFSRLEGPSQWDSRNALTSLLDILNIFNRTDLKTEVMKELERQMTTLAALEHAPGVDRARLSQLLDEFDSLVDRMHALHGQVGQELRQNEFLNSIKQRISIPGGTCDFDLPGYHFWLQRPAENRIADLRRWIKAFEPIHLSVLLLLRLVRESAHSSQEVAHEGFFQKMLDPNAPCQLVRVTVPAEAPYFAEVSGGRHRFTLRFLEYLPDGHAVQTSQDVPFKLTCCMI